LKPEYDFIFPRKDGMVYLTKDNKKGLADKHGKILLPAEYNDIRPLSNGMILLEKDKKYGFANSKGEISIPLVYDEAEDFSEDMAPVLKDGKWGFINAKNETVIDFKFVGVMMPFYNGFAPYGKRNFSSGAHYTSDLWGLIDKKGNTIIQNKYYNVSPGYNGYFVAELNGKKLLINEKEEIVALLKYEERPVQMEIGN
ncbi:TPA: WG repeat-containing protein, partial [Elizabethkingia meningoseptica]